MVQYLIRRLLLAAFTLLMILLVSYVLLRLAPGDPTGAVCSAAIRPEPLWTVPKGLPPPTAPCAKS